MLVAALTACGGGAEDAAARYRAGDYVASFAGFAARAEAGDAAAANFVGIHYYLGLGTGQDFERAVGWFERAALAGNADAQRNLGIMYMRGHGVTQDNFRAYGWLFVARDSGNPNAVRYLKELSDDVTPNAGMQAREWAHAQVRSGAIDRS